MQPSAMIEKAIATKAYLHQSSFMCCAIAIVSKDSRRTQRAQTLIHDAIAPFVTLSAYLKHVHGVWPGDEQRLAFWKVFVANLKTRNL